MSLQVMVEHNPDSLSAWLQSWKEWGCLGQRAMDSLTTF